MLDTGACIRLDTGGGRILDTVGDIRLDTGGVCGRIQEGVEYWIPDGQSSGQSFHYQHTSHFSRSSNTIKKHQVTHVAALHIFFT